MVSADVQAGEDGREAWACSDYWLDEGYEYEGSRTLLLSREQSQNEENLQRSSLSPHGRLAKHPCSDISGLERGFF